ncbi:HAD-IA family hydrolase [Gordonia sp. ABSL1-1]|uniref:HAD family hydrolase n=1 Tax=Gordonia sp. ABSL1-1 TaxID=3053923 RepID=UPI0025726F40|nr:HAD-IA family hydrolase [Gordonia sp. ABSL1-1]MDL9938325.1 HAD-IA family hydrolase [Gordonia sp. ABSL1-1]
MPDDDYGPGAERRVTAPRAVLFDFSGTLFRFEARDDWFADLHDEAGQPFHLDHQAEVVRRMTQPVGVSADLSEADRIAWERRDLDPEMHRRAYLAVLRSSGLSVPGHAEALYDRVVDPDSWRIFADTESALRRLAAAGVQVGVVSNIAFDLRAVLARHGLADLVGTYALSYEVGVIKPDPLIFQTALDALAVPATQALMIGDSEKADGGARAVGCAFALVEDGPIAQRRTALLDALAAHGLAVT